MAKNLLNKKINSSNILKAALCGFFSKRKVKNEKIKK